MGPPVIDWTISVGNLLQIVAFLVAGIGGFFALRGDIRILRHDMKNVQQEQIALGENLQQLTTVLTTLAVQGSRLDRAEESIKELRHGQGFVNPMRS